jgi:hypothetical protein
MRMGYRTKSSCATSYTGVMKRGSPSQLARAFVPSLILPGLLGCAQIAGADDYAIAERPPAVEPLPLLTGSDECDVCATDKCSEQLATCEADEVCAGWLADIREWPDPMSAYQRYKVEGELGWEFFHTRDQPSWDALTGVEDCAPSCLEPCRVGQDFTCVGNFDWEIAPPTTLRTRVATHGIGQPAEVLACLDADQCDLPLVSERTDSLGFSELRFESQRTKPATIDGLRGPTDYFRVVRDQGKVWQYSQTRPFGDNDFTSIVVIADSVLEGWSANFGAPIDDERGALVVIPVDCAEVNAKEVFIEVLSSAGENLVPCDGCAYAYAEDDTQTPNNQLKGMQGAGNAAYVVNIPEGVVYVVMLGIADPSRVLGVARTIVRGGEGRLLRLFPASKQELEALGL